MNDEMKRLLRKMEKVKLAVLAVFSRYSAGSVVAVKTGACRCVKVYTSATNGYYIMCDDWKEPADWPTACSYSVAIGDRLFTCGSKEDWQTIMKACGGNGYKCINVKCQDIGGWTLMSGGYWSETEFPNYWKDRAWCLFGPRWLELVKTEYYHVRLIAAF